MGAPDLIQWLRFDGFALALLPSGGLAVQPASKLTDAHREMLRLHRDALVLALSTEPEKRLQTDMGACDPDLHAWPHTSAMNTSEITAFNGRYHLFVERGLAKQLAEELADALVTRDRQRDDRRLCLECSHLRGSDRSWSCCHGHLAGLGTSHIPGEQVVQLQRCNGFKESTR